MQSPQHQDLHTQSGTACHHWLVPTSGVNVEALIRQVSSWRRREAGFVILSSQRHAWTRSVWISALGSCITATFRFPMHLITETNLDKLTYSFHFLWSYKLWDMARAKFSKRQESSRKTASRSKVLDRWQEQITPISSDRSRFDAFSTSPWCELSR